jgi:hypothetical protein
MPSLYNKSEGILCFLETNMTKYVSIGFASLIIFTPTLSFAQDMLPSAMSQTSIYISTSGISDSLAEERRYDPEFNEHYRKEGTSKKSYTTNPVLPPAKLTYTSSLARRSANLATLKSNYYRKNSSPEAKAMIDQLFTTGTYGAVDAKLQSVGLSSSNFADVFATHIALNWQAAYSIPESEFSDSYTVALAKQVRKMLSAEPTMRTLNDVQKQFSAEELIAQAVIASAMNEQGQTNPQFKQAAQTFGRAALKQFGFDYTQFKITSEGFVPIGKKRSDATDAAPGAETTAVASASPAKTDTSEGSSSLFPGIVIAGLAGSGIAAAFLYGKNKGANKRNG